MITERAQHAKTKVQEEKSQTEGDSSPTNNDFLGRHVVERFDGGNLDKPTCSYLRNKWKVKVGVQVFEMTGL